MPSILNWFCWTPPPRKNSWCKSPRPRKKILGTPLNLTELFLVLLTTSPKCQDSTECHVTPTSSTPFPIQYALRFLSLERAGTRDQPLMHNAQISKHIIFIVMRWKTQIFWNMASRNWAHAATCLEGTDCLLSPLDPWKWSLYRSFVTSEIQRLGVISRKKESSIQYIVVLLIKYTCEINEVCAHIQK
jgi:hypothetical protein